MCVYEFIREGRSTHAVRRVSLLNSWAHAQPPSHHQTRCFFTWEPDHHLTGVSPVLQPTPTPLGCWEVCQLSPSLTPVPGHLFWRRWSFLGLAILQGEILRDIISVVPWTQGGNRVCKETNASWNEQKCRTEERARVWEIGIKVAVVSNKKALITKRQSGLLTFKQCCCWS